MKAFGVLSLSLLLPATLALPPRLKLVQKFDGDSVPGSYIVKLKAGADKNSLISQFNNSVTHGEWDSNILHGFAGTFGDEALLALRGHPDVDSIAENGVMQFQSVETQTDATWSLQRISQKDKLNFTDVTARNYTYSYDASAGTGVDVYVIDSGINTDHEEFGGRARWGKSFGKNFSDADGNGHGTHCAGIIGSKSFGVAKNVSLIAVKVMNDKGSGQTSDIISGINYVGQQVNATGRPSLVSMSIGGFGSQPMDDAVLALINQGVHVIVASGNWGWDASVVSPARVPEAITVAASNITDGMPIYCNSGALIDVFAPGDNITSTWIGSNNATASKSGTSMAAPHVSGLVAYLIGLDGNQSPAQMSDTLKSLAAKDVLIGIPEGTPNNFINIKL